MTRHRNVFSWPALDRVAERRRDEDWLAQRLADPTSRVTLVWRHRSLIRPGDPPTAMLTSLEQASGWIGDETPVLLGVEDDRALFSFDLSATEEPRRLPGFPEDGEFVDLRQVGTLLSDREGSLLAYARGISHWHRHHLFCGRCGSETVAEHAGHVRKCLNEECGKETFPRTDPAVIMLVRSEDRALLGRQPSWPAGIYSTLAGFCEPGESLEDAVAREVREETGIVVTEAHYHSSQPWPFPSSLMLGFLADSDGGEPVVDGEELEDARWFERDEVRALTERRELRLPGRMSIARQLVEAWLRGA